MKDASSRRLTPAVIDIAPHSGRFIAAYQGKTLPTACGIMASAHLFTVVRDSLMQKTVVLFLALGLVFFVLCAGTILYHQSFPHKDMTLFITEFREEFMWKTEGGLRTLQIVEVIAKRKEQFIVTPSLTFFFLENEKEDGSLQKQIDLPELPAKHSFGLWKTQFYVLLTDDGAIGIFDTMPTMKAVQNNPDILESLIPFDLPLTNITWHPRGARVGIRTHVAQHVVIVIVHGEEDSQSRILLRVASRPQ